MHLLLALLCLLPPRSPPLLVYTAMPHHSSLYVLPELQLSLLLLLPLPLLLLLLLQFLPLALSLPLPLLLPLLPPLLLPLFLVHLLSFPLHPLTHPRRGLSVLVLLWTRKPLVTLLVV